MKKGVPGVYTRRLSVSITDIQSHRRLSNYIKLYYKRHLSVFDFNPYTYKILNSISSLSFVPCFFLAYTLCRFNELSQIDVPLVKSGAPFVIKSSKSSHVRSCPPFNLYKVKTLQGVTNSTQILVVSYDSLKSSIASARDRCSLSLPAGVLDCTHIFRHLEASWLNSKGVSISDISNRLGHKNEKTTQQYIHSNLF